MRKITCIAALSVFLLSFTCSQKETDLLISNESGSDVILSPEKNYDSLVRSNLGYGYNRENTIAKYSQSQIKLDEASLQDYIAGNTYKFFFIRIVTADKHGKPLKWEIDSLLVERNLIESEGRQINRLVCKPKEVTFSRE
ncbi:MAG: hypothetical protein QM710_07655 [Flavobacterium sp.]